MHSYLFECRSVHLFLSISLSRSALASKQHRKMHSRLTFNLYFLVWPNIYVSDAHINTAYLHFECRQSISKMPLCPLIALFSLSLSIGLCFFFSFVNFFYFGSRWVLFLFLDWKICHAPYSIWNECFTIWISSKCKCGWAKHSGRWVKERLWKMYPNQFS